MQTSMPETVTHASFCDEADHTAALTEVPWMKVSCQSPDHVATIGGEPVSGSVVAAEDGPRVLVTDLRAAYGRTPFDLTLSPKDAASLAAMLTALVAAVA